MLVELDIFSGRPNPRWELDEPTADALRQLMDRLDVATDRPPELPGLGYRGFVITDDTGQRRAYKSYVISPTVVLSDPSASVERSLRERLPAEFRELRERVPLDGEGVH